LKIVQLTLGKIIKIVATRCQILRLKCTKFNAPPDPLAGLRRPTSKGFEGGETSVVEGKGKGRKVMGGDSTPSRPLIHISGYAPDVCCVSVFSVTPSKNKVMVCRSFTV